jgi:hypothetical protein
VTSYTVDSTFNQLISATGDAPLSFSIQPGSSNTGGFTVNTAGYISGTGVADGAYALTVIVDDAQSQSTQADLTVTVAATDPYFNLTTLLLPGDGTNNANNQAFTDSSTNNFAIARNGNATQGTFSPFSQTGWGNFFGGSGNYATSTSTTIGTTTSTFTIEGWIYPTAAAVTTSNIPSMVGDMTPANTALYWGFGPLASGLLSFYWYDGTAKSAVGNTTIALNTWTHIAVSVNSNAISLYVNGTQQTLTGTTTLTNRNGATGTPTSFAQFSNAGSLYTGYISNISILSGTAKYSGNFTPSTTPLATNTTNQVLLFAASNRFVDSNTATAAKTFTLTGTPSVQAFSPFAPSAAYSVAAVGGSGYFDGTGDFLSIANNTALNVGSGDFCIEAWFNASTLASQQIIVSNAGAFGSDNTQIDVASSQVRFTSSATVYLTSSGTVVVNAWNHVAACRSGTTLSLFVNGSRQATATNSTNFANANNYAFNTGGAPGYGGQFTGYISNIRVVKGSSVYDPTQTSITIPTAPPTAITNTSLLMNYTNAGIIDATAKNVLETLGDAKISTAQSKFGGSSMYFDGTGDYLFARSIPDLTFGTGNFTVEGWFYASSLGGQPVLLNIGSDAAGLVITFLSSKIYAYFVGAGNVFGSGGATLATNTWYHFAWARSGSTHTFYIDGTAYGSTYSSAGNHSSAAGFTVAYPQPAGSNYFTGYIDDLRITRGFARYTANFTPPAATFRLR